MLFWLGTAKQKNKFDQIWSTPYIWSNLFFFVVYAFSFWTQCYLSWLGIAIHMFGKGSSLNPFWQGVGSKMFYVRFHVYPMKLGLFLGAYSQPKGLRSKPQSSAWELNQSLFPPGFWPNSSRKKQWHQKQKKHMKAKPLAKGKFAMKALASTKEKSMNPCQQ